MSEPECFESLFGAPSWAVAEVREEFAELGAENRKLWKALELLLTHYDDMRLAANSLRKASGHVEFEEGHGATKARKLLVGREK